MAASIWASFPSYPGDEQVTVCERNGNLVAVDCSEAAGKLKLQGYPDVKLTKDVPKAFMVRESAKSAILPHKQTVWKRALLAWFDPDRFNSENTKSRPLLAFSPFGFAGKRTCPGAQLVYLQATCVLVTLLRQHKVRLVEGQVVTPVYGIVTRPGD